VAARSGTSSLLMDSSLGTRMPGSDRCHPLEGACQVGNAPPERGPCPTTIRTASNLNSWRNLLLLRTRTPPCQASRLL
jgi:hypothetical protein